jgi:hypothetical protein
MHTKSSAPRAADGSGLERAIVLQLLSDEHERRWSRTQLGAELNADALDLNAALQGLNREGVVCLAEQEVWASAAARKLDGLELIGI